MSILLSGRFDADERDTWLTALREQLPGETLLAQRGPEVDGDIDIALVADATAQTLQRLPRLRFVQSLWAGVERLLRDGGVPEGVVLARMVDPAMNEAMAQTALWAVLSLHRDFFLYARQQQQRLWAPQPQRRADDVTVAVLGLGQMGATAARRLAQAGYRVSGWSARPRHVDGVRTFSGEAGLAQVLVDAQIVVNLLPLTATTTGLLCASTLTQLPRGAAVVNLARGGHVVEADLLAALASGHLSHAVLDVFATEPLPSSHPFWSHPQVTVLPHVAAATDVRSAAVIVARNVQAFRAGRAVEHQVDRQRGY
jgi:glyoxylate/hydroxypyruvate reductase A